MRATAEKGTIDNPYTMAEYEAMADNGTWPGGYVKDDNGKVTYMMRELVVDGYSGRGSGSDFEFDSGSYEWHEPGDDDEGSDGGAGGDDEEIHGRPGGGGEGNTGAGGNSGSGGGGGNAGGGTTPPTALSRALSLIATFKSDTGDTQTVYPLINKTRYADTLRRQILNPWSVNQGTMGTCGAAVICKYLATYDPYKYAEAAISLFEYGEFAEWGLNVSEASKSGTDAIAQEDAHTTALDCIVQGAFINSFNEVLNYNPFDEGIGVDSFTWPLSIVGFFKDRLKKAVETDGLLLGGGPVGFEDLEAIDYKKHYVIGLTTMDGNDFSCNPLANPLYMHYVQILGVTNQSGRKVQYWSDGKDAPSASSTAACYAILIIRI